MEGGSPLWQNTARATVPLISLCMIVKDEEPWIARCLSSVRAGVDEIIIVDTGSRDRTMDIARSFGATILQFPWKESFGEARNYSLIHATGEWILWMDADEELAVNDALKLRMVSTLQEHKLASVETIHFNGPFRPQADEAYRLAQCRLFRNGEGFHFTGGIHEQLSWPDTYTREDTSTPFQLPVRLFHYGYLQSVTTLKSKHERNLKLLQEAVTDNPNPDPWSLYHIASEYQRVGKYALAFEQVNQAIAASLGQRRLPPSLFYKLKYGCLLAMGSFREGWPGIDKAISLYPDYVDLHLYKGCILMHTDQVEAAISAFEHCLTLGENALHYMVLKGAGTFYPCYYIGNCYELRGMSGESRVWYRRALEYFPSFKEAAEKLAHLEDELQAVEEVPSGVRSFSVPSHRKNSLRCNTTPANAWSVIVMLCKGDGPFSALREWAAKWQPFADQWIVLDGGIGADADKLASVLSAHVLPLPSDEEQSQLWGRLEGVLTSPHVLWLNPYEEVREEDREALSAMKTSQASPYSMFSLNLCLQAGEVEQEHWEVERNRLAVREAVLGCNPIIGELIAIPEDIRRSNTRKIKLIISKGDYRLWQLDLQDQQDQQGLQVQQVRVE
ncbi:glycosyltransferase [Paenibacillus rhizoplanae]|uniref:Glycosyltransferase n=1 Tax=Paenibacillus rhizoplanae TaxID=1917181 RepID=A0ABW5FCR3_9BACL